MLSERARNALRKKPNQVPIETTSDDLSNPPEKFESHTDGGRLVESKINNEILKEQLIIIQEGHLLRHRENQMMTDQVISSL